MAMQKKKVSPRVARQQSKKQSDDLAGMPRAVRMVGERLLRDWSQEMDQKSRREQASTLTQDELNELNALALRRRVGEDMAISLEKILSARALRINKATRSSTSQSKGRS